jgi:hypothetical protein
VLVKTLARMINKLERWVVVNIWVCVQASHIEGGSFLTKIDMRIVVSLPGMLTIWMRGRTISETLSGALGMFMYPSMW